MVFNKLRASMALLSAAVSLVNASSHMIMGGLTPIAYERVDSIVDPGTVSSHVHAIMGSSAFDQNAEYDTLRNGRCTSVPFQTVDKSAYWAPTVHYQDQNTHEFTLMPVVFNIYYFFDRNGPNETVHAFPEGLKMVAGNPYRSTYNASNFADQAVSFVCLDYSGAVSNNPAYAERQDINFPDINACEDGIRYQIFFPMCWDGVNLDSADHQSHMAYPVDNYNSGTCPTSHPVHLVGLFFEMLVPTNGYPYWGEGAYVLSSGDPTGLGFHGDFQTGWNETVLQDSVDNCHNMNGNISACQVLLPYIDETAASACTLDTPIVNENVTGPIPALPGCNPIGVPTGSPPTCATAEVVPDFVPSTPALPAGWTDLGCIVEGTTGRALTGASTTSPDMSHEFCANFCQTKGFTYAGVEYGDECYCGDSFSNGANGSIVAWDQCNVACASNPTYSKCGGPDRLELLQFGPGSNSSTASIITTSTASVILSSSVASASVSSSIVSVPVSSSIVSVSASSFIVSAPLSSSVASATVSNSVASATVSSSVASALVSSSVVSVPASSSVASAPVSSVVGSAPVSSAVAPVSSAQSSASPISSAAPATTSLVLIEQTSSAAAPAQTSSAPASGNWVAAGCAIDGPARALTGYSYTDPSLTPAGCQSTCASKGFSIAATEYGDECYCGNSFANNLGQQQTGNHCYMSCSGDSGSTCGGTWSLNVFTNNASTSAPAPVPVAPAQSASPSSSSSSSSSPSSSSSSSSSPAGNWVASGCAIDGGARALTGFQLTAPNMTNAMCISTCAIHGFTIAGTEYGDECYCGNSFSNGLGQTQSDSACYMSCGGDGTSKCGGTWSLSIYKMQAASKRSKHFGRQHHYRSVNF